MSAINTEGVNIDDLRALGLLLDQRIREKQDALDLLRPQRNAVQNRLRNLAPPPTDTTEEDDDQ